MNSRSFFYAYSYNYMYMNDFLLVNLATVRMTAWSVG